MYVGTAFLFLLFLFSVTHSKIRSLFYYLYYTVAVSFTGIFATVISKLQKSLKFFAFKIFLSFLRLHIQGLYLVITFE